MALRQLSGTVVIKEYPVFDAVLQCHYVQFLVRGRRAADALIEILYLVIARVYARRAFLVIRTWYSWHLTGRHIQVWLSWVFVFCKRAGDIFTAAKGQSYQYQAVSLVVWQFIKITSSNTLKKSLCICWWFRDGDRFCMVMKIVCFYYKFVRHIFSDPRAWLPDLFPGTRLAACLSSKSVIVFGAADDELVAQIKLFIVIYLKNFENVDFVRNGGSCLPLFLVLVLFFIWSQKWLSSLWQEFAFAWKSFNILLFIVFLNHIFLSLAV